MESSSGQTFALYIACFDIWICVSISVSGIKISVLWVLDAWYLITDYVDVSINVAVHLFLLL